MLHFVPNTDWPFVVEDLEEKFPVNIFWFLLWQVHNVSFFHDNSINTFESAEMMKCNLLVQLNMTDETEKNGSMLDQLIHR